MEKENNTEKVPLAIIYKQDGNINIDFTRDSKSYELFGFLKCLVNEIEDDLTFSLSKKNDKG